MNNLLRAEWLKLAKRPLTWVLLSIFLLLLALQILTQFIFVALLGERPPGTTIALQIEEWQRRSSFPGMFGVVFNHANGLGGFFAVVFAAGLMGSEYSWGTLRAQLARHPDRTRFLLAKLGAIMLALALAIVLALILGALLGIALGAIVGTFGNVTLADLLMLPVALLRALYVLLPYVLITLCWTILGRSLLAGVAGGFAYLVLEAGFGTLTMLQVLGGVWQWIYNLTIGQNINALALENSRAFGLRPETLTAIDLALLPSQPQAIAVVTVYSAILLGTAIYLLRRRDITGPS
jgi:ABC-type transport system involved in multi-copper enzyme maturation permease subunit